jgi:hypothetical protein
MERHRHERSAVSPEAFEALMAHVERQDVEIEALKASDRAKDADIKALRIGYEALSRASAVAIARQAKIDAGGLMAIKDAAFEVDVTEGTIRNWFGKGLPFEMVGVRRYVNRDALMEYVAERTISRE